jgi:RNA polymerase sigma-70 factor (ECF subfamily)
MRAVADEQELMRRVAGGDENAFARLYESYRVPVANLLYRLCFDKARVDDLLQEVFLRLWRAAPGFRGDARVSTYLFRIAYNVWMNDQRKKRPVSVPDPEAAGTDDPAAQVARSERLRTVQEALRSLAENDRVILILREYNGLSNEEISEALGIPLGTVKSRLFHALRHLGERLRGKV